MENRNRHRSCSPADKPNRIIQIIRRINYGIIAENPAISLANARSLAHDNRTAVAEGRDPVLEKRMAREASRSPTPSIPTFAEAASHVIELRRPTWSNTKLAAQWRNTLATYANPLIGSKPVDEVNSGDVLAVLILHLPGAGGGFVVPLLLGQSWWGPLRKLRVLLATGTGVLYALGIGPVPFGRFP